MWFSFRVITYFLFYLQIYHLEGLLFPLNLGCNTSTHTCTQKEDLVLTDIRPDQFMRDQMIWTDSLYNQLLHTIPQETTILRTHWMEYCPDIYTYMIRLWLCLHHWNLFQCHNHCKKVRRITNTSRSDSFHQWTRCNWHRHQNYGSAPHFYYIWLIIPDIPHLFWSNLPQLLQFDSTLITQILSWFESYCLSPIWVTPQGVPNMI